mgnify:CR=1 FL=1
MKHDDFKNLVRQFLTEAEAPKKPGQPDIISDSLDAQVDRLLISYEEEAKNLKNESRDFRTLVRRLLSEAEPDEGKKTPNKKLDIDDINVESFAESVVRLINNYQNLLEVRDTLIKRSQKFLEKNYTPDVVSEFLSVLREQFDIEVGLTDVDKQFLPKPPPAKGAGPSPGG